LVKTPASGKVTGNAYKRTKISSSQIISSLGRRLVRELEQLEASDFWDMSTGNSDVPILQTVTVQ
jgi:hypothetical protein